MTNIEYWTYIVIDIMDVDGFTMSKSLKIVYLLDDFINSGINKNELKFEVKRSLNNPVYLAQQYY